MHILIAGASGAAGRVLLPLLESRGYTVTGTSSKDMDGLDPRSVKAMLERTNPDVIVHQMTALKDVQVRNIDKAFHTTNRLRAEGTRNLVEAMRPGTRLIVQSFAGWPYERAGAAVKTEDDPLDPDPPKGVRETHEAIRIAESLALEHGGIVLRYGGFYGPGASDQQAELIRKRKVPLVGSGEGVWSFVHIDDIATATLAAIEHGRPGEVYNIVDDEPAPVKEWLPVLAERLGAKPPRHVPAWLAKLIAGPGAVAMMTESRGASNAKAKRELGWNPTHASWRTSFPA
jgi:nucleoside-diphosphate-sugar epimerase